MCLYVHAKAFECLCACVCARECGCLSLPVIASHICPLVALVTTVPISVTQQKNMTD